MAISPSPIYFYRLKKRKRTVLQDLNKNQWESFQFFVSPSNFHWITCERVCVFPVFPRRSWRTSRRHRACPQRQRWPSCLASWPWWMSWCLPARSTSAKSKRRRTCRREGWWGSASAWVCARLMYSVVCILTDSWACGTSSYFHYDLFIDYYFD